MYCIYKNAANQLNNHTITSIFFLA